MAVTSEPGAKESQLTEDSQQEKEGEGEEAGAASPGETEDANKEKRSTCEVCTTTV